MAGIITCWIQIYGPPEIIQTDNGGECQGAVEILLCEWGIIMRYGTPRTPQVQGLVDQANGVVQNRITIWKMANGSTERNVAWPNIFMEINRTRYSATVKTPYHDMRLSLDDHTLLMSIFPKVNEKQQL